MEKVIDLIEQEHGYEAAERAAIYEYEAGMTRAQAEYKVRVDIDSKRDED